MIALSNTHYHTYNILRLLRWCKKHLKLILCLFSAVLYFVSNGTAQANSLELHQDSDSYLWLHFQQDVLLADSDVSEILIARNEYWKTTRQIEMATGLVQGGFWIDLIAAGVFINDNINLIGVRRTPKNYRSRTIFYGGVATSLLGLINRSAAKRRIKKIIRNYYPYGIGSVPYYQTKQIETELSLNGTGLSLKIIF